MHTANTFLSSLLYHLDLDFALTLYRPSEYKRIQYGLYIRRAIGLLQSLGTVRHYVNALNRKMVRLSVLDCLLLAAERVKIV